MSRLDEITTDKIKQIDIKLLILELYVEALLEAGSSDAGDRFCKKVRAL